MSADRQALEIIARFFSAAPHPVHVDALLIRLLYGADHVVCLRRRVGVTLGAVHSTPPASVRVLERVEIDSLIPSVCTEWTFEKSTRSDPDGRRRGRIKLGEL